jgi:predicted nucleic acid-binding protein
MVWYLDTSAFLKLIVKEEGSVAMRKWYSAQENLWSSHLLRTEALRAAGRLDIDDELVERALDTVTLVLPSVTTFAVAGGMQPSELRSLDAIHLAAALELGSDLSGVVTYDDRMSRATVALGLQVMSPN